MGGTIHAAIINWNDTDITLASVRRLAADGVRCVVIDNGSEDDPRRLVGAADVVVFKETNRGFSEACNQCIDATLEADAVLFVNGDLLYLPGSAAGLADYLFSAPDIGNVGVRTRAHPDGTSIMAEADTQWNAAGYVLYEDQPFAFLALGLVRRAVLDRCRFDVTGCFAGPGWGFEDSDYYFQMRDIGYRCCYVDGPVPYHEAHSGLRQIEAAGGSGCGAERRKQFMDKWHLAEWRWESAPHLHCVWAFSEG